MLVHNPVDRFWASESNCRFPWIAAAATRFRIARRRVSATVAVFLQLMHADRNAVNGPRMDATDVDVEPIKGPVVSCKTAFACLDRICGSDGTHMATAAIGLIDDVEAGVLPIDRLIAFAKNRGLRLRPATFDWGGLLIATATKTILLLLKNGNVVAVLGTGREGVEEVVVSDPLYQDGEPFFLPRLALEHAWGGEALVVKPRRGKAERVLAWYFSILSVFGLAAGLLLLSQAAIDVTIAGSQSAAQTPAASSRESPDSAVADNSDSAAVSTGSETYAGARIIPGADRTALPAGAETGVDPSPELAAAPASKAPETEQRPAETATAAASQSSDTTPGTAQIAARIDQSVTRSPERFDGDAQRPSAVLPPNPGDHPARASPSDPAAAQIAALLARGDALMAKGDVASARLFYERAAEAGDGQAALRLGESYDPAFLARSHLNGVRGDAVAAARWYRQARELGITEAEALLQTLSPEKDQRQP
jgi:hypothetical protein